MVNKVLINWIKENQKKGYSLEELRKILIQNKNKASVVDEAIKTFAQKSVKKKIIKKKIQKKKTINPSRPFQNFNNKRFPKKKIIPNKVFRNSNSRNPIINKPVKRSDSKPFKMPVKKDNKKWIIIGASLGGLLLVILLIISIFFLMPNKISDSDISSGTNFKLKQDKEIKFNLNDEEHKISVNSVSSDLVRITIQSNPINRDFKIGDEDKFDLDNDNYYDLLIRLEGIDDNVPEFYIKKINEIACTEDWNCTKWSVCSENELQNRTCIDLNDCGINVNKPVLVQSCNYIEEPCDELWRCENWSECINGTKTRECGEWNNCNTTIDKPLEELECCIENWTCTNWSACVNGEQNRTCTDENDCTSLEEKPDEERDCEEELPYPCNLLNNEIIEKVYYLQNESDYQIPFAGEVIYKEQEVVNETFGDYLIIPGAILELKDILNETLGYSEDKVSFYDVIGEQTYESDSASQEGLTILMFKGIEYNVSYHDNKLIQEDEYITVNFPQTSGDDLMDFADCFDFS